MMRIATRFDLEIDPATAAAVRRMADQITVVSAERVAEELRKLLVHPRRSRGVNLLLELGLAAAILPEIVLSGRAAERARELGATRILLSLSHTHRTAIAMAVLARD